MPEITMAHELGQPTPNPMTTSTITPPVSLANTGTQHNEPAPPNHREDLAPSASANSAFENRPSNLESRSGSVFRDLTHEQHEQLQIWLVQHPFDHVLTLIARPAPEGFGIQTQSQALHRYYRDDLPKHALETRRAQIHVVRSLAAVYSAEPAPYRTITLENLERNLMYMSYQPQIYMDQIVTLYNLLLKQDLLHLKERQFAQSSLRGSNTLAKVRLSQSPAGPVSSVRQRGPRRTGEANPESSADSPPCFLERTDHSDPSHPSCKCDPTVIDFQI